MRSVLVLSCVLFMSWGCEEESSSPSQSSVGATCDSTCERSVALGCPNESYSDQSTCVSQCEDQVAQCSNATIVSSYLDCVQTTPMSCGDTTGTASSPECVQQGLAYFACIQGAIDGADGMN